MKKKAEKMKIEFHLRKSNFSPHSPVCYQAFGYFNGSSLKQNLQYATYYHPDPIGHRR